MSAQGYKAGLTPIEQARMSEVGFGFEKDLTDESIAAVDRVYTDGNESDDAQEYIKERHFGMCDERDDDDTFVHETSQASKAEYTIKGFGIFARERMRPGRGSEDFEFVREYSVPGPPLSDSIATILPGTNIDTSEGNALFMLAELNSQIQEQLLQDPNEKIVVEIKGHSRGGVSASHLARDLKAIYGSDSRVKIDCVQYEPVPGGTRRMNKDPQNDYSPRSDGAVHPDVVASIQRENKAKYGYETRHDEGSIDLQGRSAVIYSTNMPELHHSAGFAPQRTLADVVILSPDDHQVGLYIAREIDGNIMKQRYHFSGTGVLGRQERPVGGIELSHLPDGIYAIWPNPGGNDQELVLLAKRYTKDEVRSLLKQSPEVLDCLFGSNSVYGQNFEVMKAFSEARCAFVENPDMGPSDNSLECIIDAMARADAKSLFSHIDEWFPNLSRSGRERNKVIRDVIKEKLLGVRPAGMAISPTFPEVPREIKYAQSGSVKKLQKKVKTFNLTLHEEAIKPLSQVLNRLRAIKGALENDVKRNHVLHALENAFRAEYQELHKEISEDDIHLLAEEALNNPLKFDQSIFDRVFKLRLDEDYVRQIFEERKFGIAEMLDNLRRQRQGSPLTDFEQKSFIETALLWDKELFEKRVHDASVQNRMLDDLLNRNPTKDEKKRDEKFIGKAMKRLFINQKERMLFESYWAAPYRFNELKETFEAAFKECREPFEDKVLSQKELAKLGNKASIEAGKRLLAKFRKDQVSLRPKMQKIHEFQLLYRNLRKAAGFFKGIPERVKNFFKRVAPNETVSVESEIHTQTLDESRSQISGVDSDSSPQIRPSDDSNDSARSQGEDEAVGKEVARICSAVQDASAMQGTPKSDDSIIDADNVSAITNDSRTMHQPILA